MVSKRSRGSDPDCVFSARQRMEREQKKKRRQTFRPGENRLGKVERRCGQQKQTRHKQSGWPVNRDDQRSAEKHERV